MCLRVYLPLRHLLQMSTKPVNTRATTAKRTGCVRRGLGHNTPFLGRSSRNAAEGDPRPNIYLISLCWLMTHDPTFYPISLCWLNLNSQFFV